MGLNIYLIVALLTTSSIVHSEESQTTFPELQSHLGALPFGRTFTRDSYREPCLANINPTSNLNLTWLSQNLVLYVTAGSMYDLLTFSELFLNKETISYSEFQNLRPIFYLQPPGFQLLSYGNSYQASCNGNALVNDHTFDCVPLPAAENVNQNVDTSKLTRLFHPVIATDNKSWLLGAGCVDDGKQADYHLVTTDPCPNPLLIANALATVTQLGFNPAFFTVVDFCTKALYGPALL